MRKIRGLERKTKTPVTKYRRLLSSFRGKVEEPRANDCRADPTTPGDWDRSRCTLLRRSSTSRGVPTILTPFSLQGKFGLTQNLSQCFVRCVCCGKQDDTLGYAHRRGSVLRARPTIVASSQAVGAKEQEGSSLTTDWCIYASGGRAE